MRTLTLMLSSLICSSILVSARADDMQVVQSPIYSSVSPTPAPPQSSVLATEILDFGPVFANKRILSGSIRLDIHTGRVGYQETSSPLRLVPESTSTTMDLAPLYNTTDAQGRAYFYVLVTPLVGTDLQEYSRTATASNVELDGVDSTFQSVPVEQIPYLNILQDQSVPMLAL